MPIWDGIDPPLLSRAQVRWKYMRFGITVCTLDEWPFIAISAAEFDSLKQAKANLLTILSIEEKFDALLENYAEYERELLDLTQEHMIHMGNMTWSTGVADILHINRRLSNLLTMTRLYTDQVRHDCASLFTCVPEAIVKCFQAEYDTIFAYRFMEALRNHVQHRGLPIREMTYPSAWEDRGGKPRVALRFSIRPHLDMQQLQENPKFKRSLLTELTQQIDSADLTILVRKHARCHAALKLCQAAQMQQRGSHFGLLSNRRLRSESATRSRGNTLIELSPHGC